MKRPELPPLVLVVEDSPDWVETITRLLLPLGVRVAVATNVRDAVQLAKTHSPDSGDPASLVVMDIQIPFAGEDAVDERGGVRALLMLKVCTDYRLLGVNVPVVVYTAYASYEHCVACMRAGAFWYVPKFTEKGRDSASLFVDVCRQALHGIEGAVPRIPPKAWLDEHTDELREQFGDRHVALIPKDTAKGASGVSLEACPTIEGYAVLARPEFEEVREEILKSDELMKLLPRILYVAPP